MDGFFQFIKIVMLVAGVAVSDYREGVAAYYREGLLREVCERRVRNGWVPPGGLDCSGDCLVAGIEHKDLGSWWLISVPGASSHV
jgi:hypothetical protein